MKLWQKHRFWIGILICIFLLTGCGDSPTPPGNGDKLSVVRPTYNVNQFPAFNKAVTDSSQVDQLYTALQKLPQARAEAICPADNGLLYKLTFTLKGKPQVHVELSASGCRFAELGLNDYRQINDAFWTQFAQALGVAKEDLFVSPVGE